MQQNIPVVVALSSDLKESVKKEGAVSSMRIIGLTTIVKTTGKKLLIGTATNVLLINNIWG